MRKTWVTTIMNAVCEQYVIPCLLLIYPLLSLLVTVTVSQHISRV